MDEPVLGERNSDDPPEGTSQAIPDAADEVLVASLRLWLTSKHVGSNSRAAAAVWRWMGAKGLELP